MRRVQRVGAVLAALAILVGCGALWLTTEGAGLDAWEHPERNGHPRNAYEPLKFAYRTDRQIVLGDERGVIHREPAPLRDGDDPRIDWFSDSDAVYGVSGGAITGIWDGESFGSIACGGCPRAFGLSMDSYRGFYPDVAFWRAPDQIMGVGIYPGGNPSPPPVIDQIPRMLTTIDRQDCTGIAAVGVRASLVLDCAQGRFSVDTHTGVTRPFTGEVPPRTDPVSTPIPLSDKSVEIVAESDGTFTAYLVGPTSRRLLDRGVRDLIMERVRLLD
ncbi:hypothetical protein ACFXHA_29500 [Nocardia sp. NPDC059240]|uniref:hypothetical protein n=1 Tax=Nocardia sp. NPDC059240 TaxID=3346786 RepID=UPI003692997F